MSASEAMSASECAPGSGAESVATVLAWPAPAAAQLNPYVALIYGGFACAGLKVRAFRPMLGRAHGDIFHVHWPEAILWGRLANGVPAMTRVAAAHALRTMDRVRARGGIVAWTVHNLAPHALDPSRRAVWEDFFPAFRDRVDLLIGMTARSLDVAVAAYPDLEGRPRAIVPHPHFRTAYPPPGARAEARARFGLPDDAFVLGMLGAVRASKGVPAAVAAFRAARSMNAAADETLLVAGACADEAERRRIGAAGAAGIVFRDAPLPPAQLSAAFGAVDAILINQRTTLNSGTLLLALSMNRPVIAPACGSVGELAAHLGAAWIETFEGELDGEKLRGLLDRLRARARPAVAPLAAFDPPAVSAATAVALADALARRRREPRHFALRRTTHGGTAVANESIAGR